MIPPKPTEILDAEARLLTCLDRLAEVLALALALERDPILRAAAAGAVPPGPCLLALDSDGPFLGYAAGGLTDNGTLAGEGRPFDSTGAVTDCAARRSIGQASRWRLAPRTLATRGSPRRSGSWKVSLTRNQVARHGPSISPSGVIEAEGWSCLARPASVGAPVPLTEPLLRAHEVTVAGFVPTAAGPTESSAAKEGGASTRRCPPGG